MMNKLQLIIDREFQKLIPSLQPEEFKQLEANILRDGCQEPLSIWKYDGKIILIDGHNRYKICEKHNKKFEVVFLDLEDREHTKLWIGERQLGRRNLTDDQRSVIANEIREWRSSIAKSEAAKIAGSVKPLSNQRLNDSDNASETLNDRNKTTYRDTRKEIAKEANVPERKLRTVQEIKKSSPALLEKVRSGEISLAEAKRTVRREDLIEKLSSVEAIKAKEISGKYDVFVIDPPWPMEKIERDERPNQVKFDYPTMSLEKIDEEVGAALKKHTDADAHVFLWTTQKFLPNAFDLLESWKMKYVCVFVWHKPGGFQPIGLPQYNGEFAVYARKGSPKFIDTKKFFTVFEAPRGKHSEKPEEFYDLLRRITGGRRLDMFNRREIQGFDGWGKESKQCIQ